LSHFHSVPLSHVDLHTFPTRRSSDILRDEAFTGLGTRGVEGIHTQWIETELIPRLETQERPVPVAEEELQRLPIELDGRLTTIGLAARLLTALGSATGAGASGSSASAGGQAQASAGGGEEAGAVTAPVPGSLVDYLVDDGAEVEVGEEVAVVSAMKMETRVEAPASGTFRQVAAVGAAVAVGEAIARVE